MDSITDATWESEVLDSDLPVLVDFWAPWCGPCKVITPHLERLAGETKDQLKVVKLNIQDHPEVAKSLNIRNIPAFLVYKGGVVVGQKFGATGGLLALRELVKPHLGGSDTAE